MPYTTTNHARFVLARRAMWYTMDQLIEFWEEMFSIKFRFEAERIAAADKIAAFIKSGKRGKEIFAYDTQFPATEDDYYCPASFQGLRTVLEDLHNVLTSVRSESLGKDVSSTRTEDQSTKQIREQKAQDENKSYQSALERLGEVAYDASRYMSREGFEAQYSLTWA